MFFLHCISLILEAESLDAGLIIRVKSFPLTPTRYPGYIRDPQTDIQTDDSSATDALYSQ